ncbi:unnamed protein product [Prunus brigantina]
MADRVYDFLAGLDDTYDKVRSDILRSDKVPSIENVFFMVHREAQCQITMLGFGAKIEEPTVAFASKNTALVSRPPGFGSSAVPPRRLTYAKKTNGNVITMVKRGIISTPIGHCMGYQIGRRCGGI